MDSLIPRGITSVFHTDSMGWFAVMNFFLGTNNHERLEPVDLTLF
jgi:hypothetical protein